MGQFLGTKNYGVIEVEQSWPVASKFDAEGNIIQQGGHIALLSNGAYCHVTGLPISSEEEITAIFQTADGQPIKGLEKVCQNVLKWFRHRMDNEEAPLPRIMFSKEGWPFFETGAPVEKEEDLYQCCPPGPVLTAAIIGLHERRKVMAQVAMETPVTHETQPDPKSIAPVNPTTEPAVRVSKPPPPPLSPKPKSKPMTQGARKYAKPKVRVKATAAV